MSWRCVCLQRGPALSPVNPSDVVKVGAAVERVADESSTLCFLPSSNPGTRRAHRMRARSSSRCCSGPRQLYRHWRVRFSTQASNARRQLIP